MPVFSIRGTFSIRRKGLETYLDSFVVKEIHMTLSSKPDDKDRTQLIITINGQLDDI